MIVVQIRGGLGNQFFTYARGYALARKYSCELKLDKYIYDTGYKWPYELEKYNISYKKFFLRWIPPRKKLFYDVYKILSRTKRILLFNSIEESENFKYFPVKLNPKKDYYLSGYWQAHQYFDRYRDEIKREFSLKNIPIEIEEKAKLIKNTCAVHVRRGDYATYKGGKILALDYYCSAIEKFRKEYPEVTLSFFSDDIDYCKKNFEGIDNVNYVSNGHLSSSEELYLMSQCKHFIIANSSYSWWAAYLGEKKDTRVICPIVDQWKEDFYLDKWEKVKASLK